MGWIPREIRLPYENQLVFLLINLLLTTAFACHRSDAPKVPAALSVGALIEEVQVRGNRRVPSDFIASKVATKRGDRINATVIEEDLQGIAALDGIDSVRVVEEAGSNGGRVVVFLIREKQ